jgi:anti-anti-sigma regulatory factor
MTARLSSDPVMACTPACSSGLARAPLVGGQTSRASRMHATLLGGSGRGHDVADVSVHTGPRSSTSEPGLSSSVPDPSAGVVLGARGGMPVVTLTGPVDHELIERADPMLQLLTLEHDGPIVIEVSGVEEVNGALLGLLLRANRRLAWRNRELIIACSDREHSRRLRIAGLDELATLAEPGGACDG